MIDNDNYTPGTFLQFSPCIIFLATYFFLYLSTIFSHNLYNTPTIIISGLPLFSVFITTIYAFFTFKKSISIHDKIDIFLNGSKHQSSLYFYFCFITAASFIHILAKTGALTTVINLNIIFLPSNWILPSLFIIASLLTIIINSWLTSIMLCLPIVYGIGQSLQINAALVAATTLSGIICGYQISLLRSNINKHKTEIFWLIIPTCILTLCILSTYQYETLDPLIYAHLQSSLSLGDYIKLIPIILFLGTAIFRFDLLVNLVIGLISSTCIAIFQNNVSYLDAISSIFEGFYNQKSILKIFLLCIFLTGLINIINYNNGFNYIVDKLRYRIKNSYLAQIIVIFLIIIINLITVFDLLSTSTIIPMIKKLSNKYNISHEKIVALLHIIATSLPCFLPYAPIILLTNYFSHSSYLEIIQYMIYPVILYTGMIISIFIFKSQKPHKKYYSRYHHRQKIK